MDNTQKRVFLLLTITLLLFLIIHLLIAIYLPLSFDEAYYWQWSKDLKLSYPDHPPMAAWLIKAGTLIAGDSSIGVRLFSIIFSFLSGYVIFYISRLQTLTLKKSYMAAVISQILPAPAAGAIIITPDVPLAFFLMLFTLALVLIIKKSRPYLFYIAAVFAALSILSKSSGMLSYATVLITAFITPAILKEFKKPHIYLAFIISIILILPWLIAEQQNGFQSILHQGYHLGGNLKGTDVLKYMFPVRWVELILGQFALLTPLVSILIVKYLLNKKNIEDIQKPLIVSLLLPVALTLSAATTTHPEQNWASISHPIAAIIVMLYIQNSLIESKRNFYLKWTLISVTILTSIIYIHSIHPILQLPPKKDPLSRLQGWNQIIKINSHLKNMDSIVCDNYAVCALIEWENRSAPLTVTTASTNRHFKKPSGKNWLIIDELDDFGNYKPIINCQKSSTPQFLKMKRTDGKTIRVIKITKGYNCKSSFFN